MEKLIGKRHKTGTSSYSLVIVKCRRQADPKILTMSPLRLSRNNSPCLRTKCLARAEKPCSFTRSRGFHREETVELRDWRISDNRTASAIRFAGRLAALFPAFVEERSWNQVPDPRVGCVGLPEGKNDIGCRNSRN